MALSLLFLPLASLFILSATRAARRQRLVAALVVVVTCSHGAKICANNERPRSAALDSERRRRKRRRRLAAAYLQGPPRAIGATSKQGKTLTGALEPARSQKQAISISRVCSLHLRLLLSVSVCLDNVGSHCNCRSSSWAPIVPAQVASGGPPTWALGAPSARSLACSPLWPLHLRAAAGKCRPRHCGVM